MLLLVIGHLLAASPPGNPLIPSVQMDKRTGKVKVAAPDNLAEKIEM